MNDQGIEHVSDTAFWIAYYRAVETQRPDALFHDPLATRLAGERGRQIATQMPASGITGWIAVMRTLIIDDFISHAVRDGFDTIVNLGAGLDTRPYRLNINTAGLRWIEVDFPGIIAFKDSALADEKPNVPLQRVALDLTDRYKRLEFFRSIVSGKAFVLTEGVVPYLSNAAAAELARDLHEFPKFGRWLLDYISPEAMKYKAHGGFAEKMAKSPLLFAPDDYFDFFAQNGWHAKETRFFWDEAERVNRPMPLPAAAKMFIVIRSMIERDVTKHTWRKMIGYTLMER